MHGPADNALASLTALTFSGIPEVPHAISTRHGGVSPSPSQSLNMSLSVGDKEDNVRANRRTFFARIGVAAKHVMPARLTHGNAVSIFKEFVWKNNLVEEGLNVSDFYSHRAENGRTGRFGLCLGAP
jgi:copper oxidase (laccase) domain-containing protein